ncbi:bifunctional transcriptional activator/DNA repair enzyme AdaA [Sutcliffiella rhizosphaerae]|uniref:Bifunctional transcriptional activator/DNA repair enzyme AdaA n=1 Tax=Sutcliffiella rhizosphaerae TaxID=2880967 RepID=A0ABM8YN95_9BACI|nr:Ada metal-binding domain-containing protein [Sutcliffiella rhizosphaerae]CAG9621285.1 Bifunctional transcriptional activator/DNA repair enzyme AdaA [Sutcliffiella rhizosphaerae]
MLTFEEMWQRIIECDRKYDGLFFTAVKTTKIYCRPSCRSRKPKKVNVEFYDQIGKVEEAGYRACKRCQPEVEHSPQVAIVKNVVTFLVNNYKQHLQLKDLAEEVGVSPFYLERVFKQETGETPRMYLEKIRIDKAAYLLKSTKLTNLEICFEVGFQSSSNFYKIFKNIKSCSPSEYRKGLHYELDGS